ncbi:MAG: hypothetical protein JWM02_3580 [Frankiales bacterium]|nr:hypothetical protein [Frankiales bacterium]
MVRQALIVSLLVTPCVAAAACPADDYMTVEQELHSSRAVVVARLTGEQYTSQGPGQPWVDGTFYSVNVERVVAGKSAKQIRLFSENSSGRFSIKWGLPYLLFVSSCDGQLYVDGKGNSAALRDSRATLRKVRKLIAAKRENAA